MSLYPEQSLQMLVDLINTANPSLPTALTTTNVLYGTPTAVTPTGGNIQNTQIKVTALAGTDYIGNVTLSYRRIDMGTLFRAIPIVIYKYSPAATNAAPYKISDLIPSINQKYGLNLQSIDFTDANLPVGNTNAVPAIGLVAGTRNSSITVTITSSSPAYQGSFTLYWVQAPEQLSQLLTVTNFENGRVFPGNQTDLSGGAYVVDLDAYSYDFTQALNTAAANQSVSLATWITYLTTGGLGISNVSTVVAATAAFVALLNAACGQTYVTTSPASTSMSLYGITVKSYALPNVNVPEADSKYFNSCLVVDLLTANSWGAGRMIFHYNV